MNYKPLLDWVLIEPEEATKKLNSIVVPDSAVNKPCKGTVIAVGSGHLTEQGKIPLEVKVGDYILFEKGSGQPIDNEKYLFIKEANILTILEK